MYNCKYPEMSQTLRKRKSAKSGLTIFGRCHIKYFEYFYMVVMVVYMAQMTNDTGRMIGGLSGNPIPLLIPIVLTLVLLSRNHIGWKNSRLWLVLGVTSLWSVLSLAKYGGFTNTEELSYIFFLYYAIVIAYIHAQVFGSTIFPIYEHILVWVCKVDLVFWAFNIMFYSLPELVGIFPETNLGRNILYVYQWITPDLNIYDNAILRNAGFSWEPGRFAIMIVLAIYVNLSRRGVTFVKNSNIVWLLLALASTQSTTGFSLAIFLLVVFYLKRFSFKRMLIFTIIFIPAIVYISTLDFMKKKIEEQLDVKESVMVLEQSFNYTNRTDASDEYYGSLDRFSAIYFETDNFLHDFWLGYGRNTEHSYFYTNVTSHYVLTGGIVKIFGQYGILMGLFIYILLAISSIRITKDFKGKRRIALFVIIMLASISYVTWCVPIFTTFWLYGSFSPDNNKKKKIKYAAVKTK